MADAINNSFFPAFNSSQFQASFRDQSSEIQTFQCQVLHQDIVVKQHQMHKENQSTTMVSTKNDSKQLSILRKQQKILKLKQRFQSLPKRQLRSHTSQHQPEATFLTDASNSTTNPQSQIAQKESSESQLYSNRSNELEQFNGNINLMSDEYQSRQDNQSDVNKCENIFEHQSTEVSLQQAINQMSCGQTENDALIEKQNYLASASVFDQQFIFPEDFNDQMFFQPYDQFNYEYCVTPNYIYPISNESDLFMASTSIGCQNFENLDLLANSRLDENQSTEASKQDNQIEVQMQSQQVFNHVQISESTGINEHLIITNHNECEEKSEVLRDHSKQDENLSIQLQKNEAQCQSVDVYSQYHTNVIKNIICSFNRFVLSLFRHSNNKNSECLKKDEIRGYFGLPNYETQLPLEETRSTIIELYNQSTRGRKSDDRKLFLKKYLKAFRVKRYNTQTFEQLIQVSSYSSVFIYYLENFAFNWLIHSKIANQQVYHSFIQDFIEKARAINKEK